MSQQGGTPTGRDDDWWGQLYDDSAEDTGPAAVGDSLDDRFASASGTVGQETPTGTAAPQGSSPAPAPAPARVPVAAPEDAVPPRGPRTGGGTETGAGAGSWFDRPTGTLPLRRTGEDPAYAPTGDPEGQGYGEASAEEDEAAADAADDDTVYARQADAWYARDDDVAYAGEGDEDPAPPPVPDRPPVTGPAAERPPAPGRPPSGAPWGPASFPSDPYTDHVDIHPAPAAPPAPSDPYTDHIDIHTAPPAAVPPPPRTPPPPPGDAVPVGRGVTAHVPREATRPDLDARREAAAPAAPDAPPAESAPRVVPAPPVAVDHIGSGPPTYEAEPTALPPADPDGLDDLVPDTVLDGAQYGACTLRAASVRGDSARYRGEPRRDALLTARFGTGDQALVLVAMATGARATPGAHHAAAEACRWIARAVGLSQVRLAEDIRAARRGDLKSGLHRLTDRSLGRLRSRAAERGVEPDEYAATLRCLLLSADPACRTRVFFGVGEGGLFRLRDGVWQDIEPRVSEAAGDAVVGFGAGPAETPEGDRLTMDLGIPTPPSPYEPAPEPVREPFRFRASVARPGDALLMCTDGLAGPLRGEAALGDHLAGQWSGPVPPGLAAFLAHTQTRVKGYADDRTAAAVWEA